MTAQNRSRGSTYRSLFTETTLSPNDQGHYSFEGEVGLIETLTLRNNATERVHVRVRDIDSDKTHRGADIPPGETVTMRFHIQSTLEIVLLRAQLMV